MGWPCGSVWRDMVPRPTPVSSGLRVSSRCGSGGGIDDGDFIDVGGDEFGGGIEEDDVARRSGFGEGGLCARPRGRRGGRRRRVRRAARGPTIWDRRGGGRSCF